MIFKEGRFSQVNVLFLGPVFGVLLNVHLKLRGQHLHLGQDTCQVAKLGCHSLFEVINIIKKLHEVILVRLKDSGCWFSRSFVSPERNQLVNVLALMLGRRDENLLVGERTLTRSMAGASCMHLSIAAPAARSLLFLLLCPQHSDSKT